MALNVHIGCVANLYSRMMHFEKVGDVEIGHTHQFDHLTLLASGRLQVTVEGAVSEFSAPHMLYIAKDKVHELVALEDNTTAYCIHAMRFGEAIEDIVDPSMIPAGVFIPEMMNKLITQGTEEPEPTAPSDQTSMLPKTIFS
jgi:hypothetical protein